MSDSITFKPEEGVGTPPYSPPEGTWFISRDGGIQIDGDWVAQDSWTANYRYPRFGEGNRPYWFRSDVCTVAAWPTIRIAIYGQRKGGKLRPYRFFGRISFLTASINLSNWRSGSYCKSLVDATRRAKKLVDDNGLLEQVVKQAYQRNRVTCISKAGSNGEAIPYLSYFGEYLPTTDGSMPTGDYLMLVGRDYHTPMKNSRRVVKIDTWGSGPSRVEFIVSKDNLWV